MSMREPLPVTKKSVLLKTLASELPDDLMYSLCLLEKVAGERVVFVLRGQSIEGADFSDSSVWCDPYGWP